MDRITSHSPRPSLTERTSSQRSQRSLSTLRAVMSSLSGMDSPLRLDRTNSNNGNNQREQTEGTMRTNGVLDGHDVAHPFPSPRDDSPLSRAGLLQPRSHVPSYARSLVMAHSQGDIRTNTMQLSSYVVSSPLNPERDDFIFPSAVPNSDNMPPPSASPPAVSFVPATSFGPGTSFAPSSHLSKVSSDLSSSTSTLSSAENTADNGVRVANIDQEHGRGNLTPRGTNIHIQPVAPSGLSILLARHASGTSTPTGTRSRSKSTHRSSSPTPTAEHPRTHLPERVVTGSSDLVASLPEGPRHIYVQGQHEIPTESTHLLSGSSSPGVPSGHGNGNGTLNAHPAYVNGNGAMRPSIASYLSHPNKTPHTMFDRLQGCFYSITGPQSDSVRTVVERIASTVTRSLPAVTLGVLLNVLDGVSYGMIIFPASGIFTSFGGMGVSMFFVSTVISQLVYTFGGSGFAGANGSMMIEVVPFFHILANSIAGQIGEENVREVMATTLAAYALSSILTGLSFFLLGWLRLGVLIGFFPRHILVGCIGGVGVFLIITGLAISTRISDDELTLTLSTLRFFLLNTHSLTLWVPPFSLAVLLRLITMKWRHQLVFPLYFIAIPTGFYIIVAAAQLDLGVLRREGWIFEVAEASQDVSWYQFYTYFDLKAIRFGPLWSTLPTQFALLFFNILHPPLNVPALSVSLGVDIDTNKELVGHGYSNLLAGFLGTVPNYLVYVNTLLFYRVGGTTRIAGFLLVLANIALLLVGTGPIAYIPVMVVGSLIFVLGIDLVKEALWDTRHRVSRSEYITIISIMICMTAWDFVIGVLFGIVISCFFFVVQNSQRKSIRACYTGDTAVSTVRRPAAHRAYIREASKQTMVLRLQGFLFFGTIAHVEDTIRSFVDDPAWKLNPVRFVVVDLSLVAGVDMSSAEAFVRVQRLLAAKQVVLVFCGIHIDSPIMKALQSVGVLGEDYVEVFELFNDAMEWTENAYLRVWFRSQKMETTPVVLPGRQDVGIGMDHSFASSPRHLQLRDLGDRTIAQDFLSPNTTSEPHNTLIKAFSSYDEVNLDIIRKLAPYFERMSVPEGLVLWDQNDQPDGLYIIESGVLRATYKFATHTPDIEQSMVPGTLAGELSALSGMPRNARVVVERQGVLWKLSTDYRQKLERNDPQLAQIFVQLVLKAAKIDNDILLAALATRQ